MLVTLDLWVKLVSLDHLDILGLLVMQERVELMAILELLVPLEQL